MSRAREIADRDLAATELILDADNDTSITADTDDEIHFKVAGDDHVKIKGGTNVLHVIEGSSGQGTPHTNSAVVVESDGETGINILSGNTNFAGIVFGDDGDNDIGFIQYKHDDNYLRFGTNTSERMRIESDGTVLIKSQDLKVGDGSTADAKVQFDANSDWTIGIDASDSGYLKVSNGVEVHSAPKMVFKAGGLIEHLASRDGNLNYFQNSHSSNPYGLSVAFDQASPDNNTNYFFRGSDASAIRINIWSDGDVSTSDAGVLSSDEKLKNTITDATDKWDDVKKLKVRNFYWNEDYHPKKKDKKMIGFIAQEFETVFPGLVKEYKDTIDKEVEDENGFKSIEAVETGTTTKHIKEAKLIPILTKALQEAMVRIETLEAKVQALEEA